MLPSMLPCSLLLAAHMRLLAPVLPSMLQSRLKYLLLHVHLLLVVGGWELYMTRCVRMSAMAATRPPALSLGLTAAAASLAE